MNFEPEEIVPLDPEDPTVVTATITSVTDIDLPFTQLADGDKRVRGHQQEGPAWDSLSRHDQLWFLGLLGSYSC